MASMLTKGSRQGSDSNFGSISVTSSCCALSRSVVLPTPAGPSTKTSEPEAASWIELISRSFTATNLGWAIVKSRKRRNCAHDFGIASRAISHEAGMLTALRKSHGTEQARRKRRPSVPGGPFSPEAHLVCPRECSRSLRSWRDKLDALPDRRVAAAVTFLRLPPTARTPPACGRSSKTAERDSVGAFAAPGWPALLHARTGP